VSAAEPTLPRRILCISSRFTTRPDLLRLKSVLASAGVEVDGHATFEAAFAAAEGPPPAEALLLDASFAAELTDARVQVAMEGALAQVRAAAPELPLLLLVGTPSIALVSAAFRGGATDLFDPSRIEQGQLLRTLSRARTESRRRSERARLVDELRTLTDDFLKHLVRAERRVIELEEALGTADADADDDAKGVPRILVVDDDAKVRHALGRALEARGLVSIEAQTGEAAIDALASAQARKAPIDLAIVDRNLAGIDGVATIHALRKLQPSLPTMVMTGFAGMDTAVAGADLVVVGYVLKPFDDLDSVAGRVHELATRYAKERRNRRHLSRIKRRHSHFLERYQTISAQLDALKA
jgi:DNA-binding NtrC family response regulator